MPKMRSAYQKVGGANVPVLLHTRSDGSTFIIGGEIVSPDQLKLVTSPDDVEDKAQAAAPSGPGTFPVDPNTPAMTAPGADQSATIAALVDRVNLLSERMGQPPLDLASASDSSAGKTDNTGITDTSVPQAGSTSPVTAQPSAPAQGVPTGTIPPAPPTF